jgi:hypothetical protein
MEKHEKRERAKEGMGRWNITDIREAAKQGTSERHFVSEEVSCY